MKRKTTKTNRKAAPIAKETFVFVRRRTAKHVAALNVLFKQFGSRDFGPAGVFQARVSPRILRELVEYGYASENPPGRFQIPEVPEHPRTEIIQPIFPYKFTREMIEQSGRPFPATRESKALSAARENALVKREISTENLPPRFPGPVDVIKRFRMPYKLYQELRPRFGNISAYIRHLIYADLGMDREAAAEKDRMEPLI